MLQHFFVNSATGDLYDTRDPDWSHKPPLRHKFQYGGAEIRNAAEFKGALRAGKYAWPGGHPFYFLCRDAAALCFACARKEARLIIDSFSGDDQYWDCWRVVGKDINYEDTDLVCDNCAESIESAYGD
jgi:hypothetical protein